MVWFMGSSLYNVCTRTTSYYHLNYSEAQLKMVAYITLFIYLMSGSLKHADSDVPAVA